MRGSHLARPTSLYGDFEGMCEMAEIKIKMPVDDDLFISVFNTTDYTIRKAKKAYRELYGIKKYEILIGMLKDRGGIMCIFETTPTTDILIFALMLTQYNI